LEFLLFAEGRDVIESILSCLFNKLKFFERHGEKEGERGGGFRN